MKSFYQSISNSPFFTFLAGIASVIGLIISYNNDKIFYWLIFTLIVIIFLQLLYLINLNNKMLNHSSMVLGKMDVINFNVFESKVELEENEEGSYVSNADIFFVIQSALTPDTLLEKPVAIVQIQFPSQLRMKFYYRNHLIKQIENTNNTCSFEIPIGKDSEFIAIRSIHLKVGEEETFKASSKKIDVSITCSVTGQAMNESIPISSVGW
ncbi:hypothetical protein CON66_27255 [Bacillus cereus]|uniref:hypothetical protein n=1 Tax=Bacillus cereus TaxID=1396 RepID=UPI000BEB96B6|nr:hypothetical protein [Bacillus cereus]PEA92930.1 hypothetical protein CON66_27255 [Bacillus cereus]PED37385.1 hypothetical protein CON24_14315 [Bacillus cereus]